MTMVVMYAAMTAAMLLSLVAGDASIPCIAPPMTHPWIPRTEEVEVKVQWGLDENRTCHTRHSCHPGDLQEDVGLDLQLIPFEVQEGVTVSFESSLTDQNWTIPILPFEVDEESFQSCDTEGGQPIWEMPSNESVVVNSSFLSAGAHYFIVNDPDGLLARCELGMRLKVTVKPVRCLIVDGVVCSANGLCLTEQGQPDYKCYCCGKYTGDNCEKHDSCPCQNGGHCLPNGAEKKGRVCACRRGYHGSFCEKRITNMCDVISCNNSGTCTGNETHFHCACPPGFKGSHCEVNINECESNPCVQGICVDDVNGYKCFCRPGYHGRQCQLDYDECATVPCKNGGFCQEAQDNFTCHCHPGFTGRHCSTKVYVCAKLKPCVNGAKCLEMKYNYKCKCRPGYIGVHCEVDVDDCAGGPCLNGGTCVDGVAGYTCLCQEMHAGPNCQYPLDVFGPMIDLRETGEVGEEERAFHERNMYVVTAALTCAVLVALGVLVACYCRVHGARPATLMRRNNYRRQRDDTVHPVDVSSVTNPRLSVDAIWEASGLNYDVTQLGSPARQDSLKSRDV